MKKVSDLVGGFISRTNIHKQVQSSMIVVAANTWLEAVLPVGHTDDACAISFKDEILTIGCTNSAARTFIKDNIARCRDFVVSRVPEAQVTKISARLVSDINPHDI
ncbi:MAG: hypothetical protein O2877_01365 [bacterium]|nr:hypothetical protein [bacterium]